MSHTTFPLNSTGSTDEYETDDYSPSSSSTTAEEEETTGRCSRAATTRGRRRAPPPRGRDPPSDVSGAGCGSSKMSKGATGVRSSDNRNSAGGSGKSSGGFRPPGSGCGADDGATNKKIDKKNNSENDLLSGSDDDDDDDDDDDSDPFANLSRFQGNKRRKLPSENSSASHSSYDDDDSERDGSDCSSSYSSSDEYATKKKKSSAKAAKKTVSSVTTFSAKRNPPNSRNSDSHADSDGSVSSVEFLGPASRKNPVRNTRSSLKTKTAAASTRAAMKSPSKELVEKKSMVDKTKSTDSGLIELLSDDDDIICGTFRRSPEKQVPYAASSAAAAATMAQKKKGTQHDPLVRAESQAALEKGRKARDRLKAAQQYKAKEVGLPPPSPPPTASLYPTSCQNSAPVKQPSAMAPAAATVSYTGPTIQLTLQYSHPMTNKNSKSNVKIKMDQPLQHLMDAFNSQQQQFNGGSSILRITNVTFDGEKMNMTKTPTFYDMEDSDLVDVSVVQA